LKACYGNVWSCLDIKNINSSVFNQPMGEEVKKLNRNVKTSTIHPQALKGVVSRLHWASTFFLRKTSLIPKRLWIYSLACDKKLFKIIYKSISSF
jgi:hypothetical protein